MQYKTLEDTAYFWFAANLTTGTAGDGASPTFAVRKAGASSSAAPTLTGTPTLLSHASYSDGSHEIAVAATAANGFEAAATYGVFCSLLISSVNPNGFVGSFVLSPVNATAKAMDAAVANKVADHVRRRTQANVEASSDGDAVSVGSEYGFIQQVQESAISGATLTIYKVDGTTSLGTKTVASDASASPVTGVS